MIALRDAGVRRGDRWIFRGVNFELPPGETLTILGRNGRGKTTLLRALLGSLHLNEGLREMPAVVGYVPQLQQGGDQHLCIDVVMMARAARLGMFGLPGKSDRQAALVALQMVGADRFADRLFGTLSGGEKQIILLARALVTEAKVLVLDEPAAALDLANQDLLLQVLMRLRRAQNHSIIFTTHNPQHGLILADKVLMMHDGNEVVFGKTSAVMADDELSRLYGVPFWRSPASDMTAGHQIISPIFGSERPTTNS